MSKTIFDSEKQENNEKGTPKQPTNKPLLTGGDENLTGWVSQDKQGNYYLSLDLPLGLGRTPMFVNDAFKDAFNQMIQHLIEKDELDPEAIN